MMTQSHCRMVSPADADSIFSDDDKESSKLVWHERLLYDLTEVATLLDCLEIWGVKERWLYTFGNGAFLVEWRA